jgi:GNAT superfamily N-acetyltransferase
MALDHYHLMLKRLLEQTGGNEKTAVNLQELTRKEGFAGAYNDIYDVLSREGWTADAPRPQHVYLTHWGIAEIRRVDKPPAPKVEAAPPAPAPKPEDPLVAEARRLAGLARAVAEAFEAEAKERAAGRNGDAQRASAIGALEALQQAAAPPAPEPQRKKAGAKKA